MIVLTDTLSNPASFTPPTRLAYFTLKTLQSRGGIITVTETTL